MNDSDNKPSNNQEALEQLRILFSDSVDLEQELYQTYESQLNSFGIKFGFYFPKDIQMDFADFFKKYNLWQIFSGSMSFPDIFFMGLRDQMQRPWLLARDFFNVEIQIGNVKVHISNQKNKVDNCLDLQQLLSQIYLFQSYPSNSDEIIDNAALAREFKTNKYFIVKLIRTKKELTGFRKYLETENCILNSDTYRDKLEVKLQEKVKDILANLDITEDVIRMHLQERLALWGYRFSKVLTEDELIQQYEIVKAGHIFPSVLDSSLLIQSLTYNSNEQVIDSIKNNEYKEILRKFLSRIETQKILLMKYNGVNLEGNPEFLFNIKVK